MHSGAAAGLGVRVFRADRAGGSAAHGGQRPHAAAARGVPAAEDALVLPVSNYAFTLYSLNTLFRNKIHLCIIFLAFSFVCAMYDSD